MHPDHTVGIPNRKTLPTVEKLQTALHEKAKRSPDFRFDPIGRCDSPKTGKASIGTRPSRKKITRLCRKISEMTGRRPALLPVGDRVEKINRKLIGWSNDFCLGPVSQAYDAVVCIVRGTPDR